MQSVTISTIINAPIDEVWARWTQPEHVTQWTFASDDWESPTASNDLRVGGAFTTRMQAKDGSFGFDFGGTYTAVEEPTHIAYDMADGRHVDVCFELVDGGVRVTETFDLETENSADMQRAGWQAILENFKKYVEAGRKSAV